MLDERREFHKIRPASHTLLSVNCLYQMNAAESKGGVYKVGTWSSVWIETQGPLTSFGIKWEPVCDGMAYSGSWTNTRCRQERGLGLAQEIH